MSNLQKIKERNHVVYKEQVKMVNDIPVYGSDGKLLSKKQHHFSVSKKGKAILVVLSCFLVAVLLFLYVPQIFMQPTPPSEENEPLVAANESVIATRQELLKSKGNEDFDKDGKSNAMEIKQKTNPFDKSSSKIGFYDGFTDMEQTEDNFQKIINEQYSVSSLRIQNVILWPDNDYYKAHCGVVKNASGDYVFDNFKGWVEFEEGKYAYKINEYNEHILLKKRSKENAWYIDEEHTVVTVTDKAFKTTNKFVFFGNKTYMSSNFFSDLLSTVLADYGLISCKKVCLEDTYVETDSSTNVEIQPINYNEFNYERLKKNTNSLTDLANVYKTITEKSELLVSVFQEDKGETVLEVYGFNDDGSLNLVDPQSQNEGILRVYPHSYRSINQDGNISQTEYFDFKGCGFDSTDGKTTICFFKNTRVLS